jgi:hypothetical protein
VVCSDETSALVSGKNWWDWVFIGTLGGERIAWRSDQKLAQGRGSIAPMVAVQQFSVGSQQRTFL